MNNLIIGIAGGSGSGKTTLSQRLRGFKWRSEKALKR